MEQNNHPKIETGYGIATGSSSFETGRSAAKKALESILKHNISAVIVHASAGYNLSEVLQGISEIVGDAPIFGTSTAGEICNGAHHGTVLVVVLASPYLKVHCGIGRGVSTDWRCALDEAMNSQAIKPFFQDISEFSRKAKLEGKNIFIMLFSPGKTNYSNSYSYEILETLKAESLGIYPIIGGSSADDWDLESNYVFYGNKVYSDSTLLAIFETELQFGISMTHGVHPTAIKTTVTSVEGYEVLTLDSLPAVDTFSKLLDIPKGDLLEKYTDLSTGIILGMPDPMGQYSIHTASYFTPRGGIRLTSKVTPGTTLTVMERNSTNMLTAGTESIRKAIIRGGINDIAISFTFYCALLPKIIGQAYEGELAEMTEMLGGKPMVGFFSFGEHGVGDDGDSRYNNTAVACLVIGNEFSDMAKVALENKRLLKEIREYDQLKTEFIANISHEFRTPINVILGTLQLFELQNSPLQHLQKGEKAEQYMKVMKQNCYRLVRLTNNLIDITKLESGYTEINLRNHNIVQVIEDITQSVAEYIKSKGLELLFDTDTEEKLMAIDADKLERIMLNLLSNAVKFSRIGGRISVNFQDNNESVRISVKDTGIGIPQDKHFIIFERFRQVDSSLSRSHEGSGIGLSLVKSLVELHGGKITLNSAFVEGAEFIVDLPVKIVADPISIPAECESNEDHVHRIMMEFSDIYAL